MFTYRIRPETNHVSQNKKNILYVTPIRFQHNLALKEDSVQMYNVSPVAHSSGKSLRRTFEYPLNFVLQKIFGCFFFANESQLAASRFAMQQRRRRGRPERTKQPPDPPTEPDLLPFTMEQRRRRPTRPEPTRPSNGARFTAITPDQSRPSNHQTLQRSQIHCDLQGNTVPHRTSNHQCSSRQSGRRLWHSQSRGVEILPLPEDSKVARP